MDCSVHVHSVRGEGSSRTHVGNVINAGKSLDERRTDILKILYTSPYRDRKDRNPERVPGTCEWFVGHDKFREWRQSPCSSLLWVSADPGCGKSVLARHLVDTEIPSTEIRTTCYFFFKDDFEDQRSTKSALCCLLHQLFLQKPNLLSQELLIRLEKFGLGIRDSFADLWDTLLEAIKPKHAGEIVCLLDAYDECEQAERQPLTQAICKFYGAKNDLHLKFLITGRPYLSIRRGFKALEVPGLAVVHLSGESEVEADKISREIDLFVRARARGMQRILDLTPDEMTTLLNGLLSVPNRTYLWTHLTLDLLHDGIDISKTSIETATRQLPRTVDEAYEKILGKSQDSDNARKLLHIIVAAERPLSLAEMAVALAIQPAHQWQKDLDVKSGERLRQYIRDLCGLFVTTVDSRIYLLHQTAKEFLVQNALVAVIPSTSGLKWKSSLCPQESHSILFQACATYLSLRDFDQRRPLDFMPPRNDIVLSVRRTAFFQNSWPFFDYAARHWIGHFRESDLGADTIPPLLYDAQSHNHRCMQRGPISEPPPDNTPWVDYFSNPPETINPKPFKGPWLPLTIASYVGLSRLVDYILADPNKESDIDARGELDRCSALSWASAKGHYDVVQSLIYGPQALRQSETGSGIRQHADVNLADNLGYTPLNYAVANGHGSIVKILLQAGAHVNIGSHGMNPLQSAVREDFVDIASMLLEHGADPKLWAYKDPPIPEDPLTLARSAPMVELLLRWGTDVNGRDLRGETALHRAILPENIDIVEVLLNSGADVDAPIGFGATALHFAAGRGYDDIPPRLLDKLDKIARRESKEAYGLTPLSVACSYDRRQMAQILLQRGANIESKDCRGRTPLAVAAMKTYNNLTISFLISKGADVESRDSDGQTPLFHAVREGSEETVGILLAHGARLDAEDCNGKTPMMLAMDYGWETWHDGASRRQIAKKLLERALETQSELGGGRSLDQWVVELERRYRKLG